MAGDFGAWLRGKRGRKGDPGFITQEALAQRIGVTRSYIVQIESKPDTPTFPTRRKIHDALGTSEDELIALGIIDGRGARPAPGQGITETSASESIAAQWSRLSPEAKALVWDLIEGLIRMDEIPGDRAIDRTKEPDRRHGT